MDIRLETPRLILREYQLSDLPSIHAYASQSLTVRYENWGPNSYLDTQQFLQQTQRTREQTPRYAYELSIERKEDGRQMGGCELAISQENDSIAAIGYVINPIFWNQGYATEVTSALVRFGLKHLRLSHIRATCDSRNVASKRVLEKAGFLLEQTLIDDFVQKGEMRTTLVYAYPAIDHLPV